MTEDKNKHYVLIKDVTNLCITKQNIEIESIFACIVCNVSQLVRFITKTNCMIINVKQAIKMPEADSKIKFENFHKQQAVPFAIYAEFEAITEKVQGVPTKKW